MYRVSKIVVCPKCKGEGTLLETTGEPGEYRVIDCPVCGGRRIMKKIVIIKYKRIDDDESKEKREALEAGDSESRYEDGAASAE